MSTWKQQLDTRAPFWADYREYLERLPANEFPGTDVLNGMRPARSGSPLPRFVTAAEIPGVAYEQHIYEHGEVSTRENNWHDLFNALVWFRLPALKSAMNRMHYSALGAEHGGRRGGLRDALTLLDESGALLFSSNHELLQALGERDWSRAFIDLRESWQSQTRITICGHALLEKFLQPYKSMTAHILMFELPQSPAGITLEQLEPGVTRRLLENEILQSPAGLSPLPLMGIPGWFPNGMQDAAFYADAQVFRPPPSGLQAPPIYCL